MRADSSLPPPPQRFVAVSKFALGAILFWVVLASWVPEHGWFGLAEVGVLALGLMWGICLMVRPFALQLGLVFILLGSWLDICRREEPNW
jgi:hypothetical protein